MAQPNRSVAAPRCIGRALRAAGAALLVALLPPIAAAQPSGGLTLEQALRAAQERSRALAAQDAAALSAREMAVAAGQLPDPTLRLGVSNLPVSGAEAWSLTRDFMTMRNIGVMQELTRADKRRARAARYEREADAAHAARGLELANLRRETATAWFERYFQERMLGILREQRAEAALQIDAADAAYRAGRGSQADAFAARSQVAQIEDRIRRAERELATARTQLARWVGEDASALSERPAIDRVRLRADRLEEQLERHPEVALLSNREALARAEADVARENRRPDWSVELMYSQRGSAFGNMISIGVAIPLPWDRANRQDRELGARLATIEQVRAEREELVRQRVADARRWWDAWRSDLGRLEHYDRSLIPLAAERTRAALAAYRGGAGPLAAVLEARRSEIDVRMERLGLEMEAAGLWAQLEYLIPDEPVASAAGDAGVLRVANRVE